MPFAGLGWWTVQCYFPVKDKLARGPAFQVEFLSKRDFADVCLSFLELTLSLMHSFAHTCFVELRLVKQLSSTDMSPQAVNELAVLCRFLSK